MKLIKVMLETTSEGAMLEGVLEGASFFILSVLQTRYGSFLESRGWSGYCGTEVCPLAGF